MPVLTRPPGEQAACPGVPDSSDVVGGGAGVGRLRGGRGAVAWLVVHRAVGLPVIARGRFQSTDCPRRVRLFGLVRR